VTAFTVGQLRALIAKLPDDMTVTTAYHVVEASSWPGYFMDGDDVIDVKVTGVPGQPEQVVMYTESFYEGVDSL
jgi:hypothetical protein